MEKKRLEYLDMVKGIGIIGIVVMHSTLLSSENASRVSLAATPLFFLVSGMLISCTRETERTMKEVFKRRGRSLLLPFLCFSLIYIVRDFVGIGQEKADMATVRMDVLELVTFWGISVLWFLTTLFFSNILFIFLRRRFSAGLTYLICLILTVMSFFANGFLLTQNDLVASSVFWYMLVRFARGILRAVYALPFLCIGYGMFEHFRGFWEKEKKSFPLLIAGGVLLLGTGIFLIFSPVIFDFRMLYFGENPVLAYLEATLFFTGLVLVCKNCPSVKALVYLGKNSLIIMATHIDFYFLYLGLSLANRVNNYIPRWNRAFYPMIVFGAVFALEVVCITVINRFFPVLAGKRKYFHSTENLL